LFESEIQQEVLQGQKPDIDLIGYIGLTKVMPLLQSLWELPLQLVFPQPLKSCPDACCRSRSVAITFQSPVPAIR
jgi:hypothetical protein